MVLILAKDSLGRERSQVTFPTTAEAVRKIVAELEETSPFGAIHIADAEGAARSLFRYLSAGDLFDAAGIEKLNRLAALVDAMEAPEQRILAGALDAESINGLDDVLRVASRLDQYEFIEGVTSDKALGGWLVKHGLAGVDFPKPVRPYLDYAGIGAEYYASHGGAYTPQGYVKRREMAQAATNKTRLALVLRSGNHTCRLDFPVSENELEAAGQALGVSELTDNMIDSIVNGYDWHSVFPLDGITLKDYNTLAQCVLAMSATELRTFGAALEAEGPDTFSQAVCIAMDLDDYELVDMTEGEYGRTTLRYAGAGDEILDILDGYTDFERLGRALMEEDGVRETDFGQVKRLSAPWPQQAEQGQTMC